MRKDTENMIIASGKNVELGGDKAVLVAELVMIFLEFKRNGFSENMITEVFQVVKEEVELYNA